MLIASPAAWAALVEAANWQMDETSGQMIDSSANHNDGSPTDVLQTGSTYRFNGSTSRVAVRDTNDGLDPLEKDITLRASVRVTDEPMDDDSYDGFNVTDNTTNDYTPSYSPNGKEIVYRNTGFNGRHNEIYTIKVGGGGRVQVTNDTKNERDPSYSPSGKRISYSGYDGQDWEIYTINAGGGGR